MRQPKWIKETRFFKRAYRMMEWVVIVSALLMIVACSESKNKELQNYIKEVQSRPPKPIESIPQMKLSPVFIYPNVARRNPFNPLQRLINNQDAPDQRRKKEPLEKFPLDSLQMVGTFAENNRLWALISATDGIIYRVAIGSYLGQNYGRITKITPNAIYITEKIRASSGWESKPIMIKLTGR